MTLKINIFKIFLFWPKNAAFKRSPNRTLLIFPRNAIFGYMYIYFPRSVHKHK